MLNIPSKILGFKGQKVKELIIDEKSNKVQIICKRDNRFNAIDMVTKSSGKIIKRVTREVTDIPFLGCQLTLKIERAQIRLTGNRRVMEDIEFCDDNCYFTQRYARLVSGLCRHMSIRAVSNHLNIRWNSVKNIDKYWLNKSLPALDPSQLTELKYIGVDEVARAKGHDYMTVVYDMQVGHLIGVETGRTADVMIEFLNKIPKSTREQIEAVAMDMGLAYQKAVREVLPNADIVFDRFHVMQNYSKAIKNQRRVEFRKANKEDKELIKGSTYLLLGSSDKLNDKQEEKLATLLEKNANLNAIYLLKEQLQAIWSIPTYDGMQKGIDKWCEMANQTGLHYIMKFAK